MEIQEGARLSPRPFLFNSSATSSSPALVALVAGSTSHRNRAAVRAGGRIGLALHQAGLGVGEVAVGGSVRVAVSVAITVPVGVSREQRQRWCAADCGLRLNRGFFDRGRERQYRLRGFF